MRHPDEIQKDIAFLDTILRNHTLPKRFDGHDPIHSLMWEVIEDCIKTVTQLSVDTAVDLEDYCINHYGME